MRRLGVALIAAALALAVSPISSQATEVIASFPGDEVANIYPVTDGYLVLGTTFSNSDTSTVFYGDAGFGGSDIYLRKLDSKFQLVWSHRFGTTNSDFAHSLVADKSGNYWILATTSLNPSETNTAQPTQSSLAPGVPTLNPDGVSLASPQVAAPTPTNALWLAEVDNSGKLLNANTISVKPQRIVAATNLLLADNRIVLVGNITDPKTGDSDAFYVLCAQTCETAKYLGKKSTYVRVAHLEKNQLLLAGSTKDIWPGKKAIGKIDAFAMVLDLTTGKQIFFQRSGNKSAVRSWESGYQLNGQIVLSGFSELGTNQEVVTTTFAKNGNVTGTARFPSNGSRTSILPKRYGSLLIINSSKPISKGLKAGPTAITLSPTRKLISALNLPGLNLVGSSGIYAQSSGKVLVDWLTDSDAGLLKRYS